MRRSRLPGKTWRCTCGHRQQDHTDGNCRVCTCTSYTGQDDVDRVVKAQVRARDGRCLLDRHDPTGCYGRLTYHHLVKASAGGKVTVENGVTLCVAHNGWVEDNPAEARRLGLVVIPGVIDAVTADRCRRVNGLV